MTARIPLFAILFLCAAVAADALEDPALEDQALQDQRPNVILMFADDLGYGDLGSYGAQDIATPNLDTLAAGGQRWTDFYVAAPVCSPSRGALLTGRLPVRTGLYGRQIRVLFPGDSEGMPHSEVTLAEVLRDAGYQTAIVGKWHLGDASHRLPTRHGFDEWFGIPYSNDMDWADGVSFDEALRMRAAGRGDEVTALYAARYQRYFDPRLEFWNVPLMRSRRIGPSFEDSVVERPTDQRTLTRRYTEEAVRIIERAEKPFFLYMPYTMPHTPIFRSEAFAGRSARGRYGDVIEEIDWSVGEVIKTLKKQGIERDTLVVFTSDNGPWLTMREHGGSASPLRHGKGTTFEGGVRVPAIFSWPGTVEPAVIEAIGMAADLFTTIAKLAGGTLPDDREIDGVDLSRTLLRGEPSPRRWLAYYRAGELTAFRSGDYKIHFVTEGAYGDPPPRQQHDEPLLYNLREDPGEQIEISAAHPGVVARLVREAERHKASITLAEPIFDQRLATLVITNDQKGGH
ncbi:MAG: sulfatase [Gammaproteobacteria bacterium]|nr:sulfatase [Gammaproteobacteria bacterium]